jgi:energy-coupling factor transporter transmembrane protein EcfT
MRTSLHDVFGCARGHVSRLAPHARLLAGAAAFAACMIAPAASASGSLFIAAVVAVWLTVCHPPLRVVCTTAALGLVLFLPYFLLLPLLPDAPSDFSGDFGPALAVPWSVLVCGMSGMLVSAATATSLSTGDLREALVRLPVPRVLSAILLQIVHQTAALFYETRRVAAAMAVRGASSGILGGLRVLVSLPRVWLPRVADRAERVACAMELRGFCDEELRPLRHERLGLADAAALIAAATVLGGAVVLRLLEGP